MTISGFQSYSFSALTMQFGFSSGTAPSPATSRPTVDTVTLSPAAAAPAEGTPGADAPPAPTEPPPPPPLASRAERRAAALFTALDADGDGTVTKDEFTSGALDLLRNAGSRRRIRGDGDDERQARRLDRLERKLEKVFERVDGNDDGSISADELTEALSRTRGRGRGQERPEGPPPAPPVTDTGDGATAAPGTSLFISVTFVSVAMQRYTAAQDASATA